MTAASPALRFWVDMALECVRRDHTPAISIGDQRGPFLTARALGMALAALHDARALAAGQPALLSLIATPGLAGANPEIAGAAACCQLLRERYPKQASLLDPAWQTWRELFPAVDPDNAAEIAGRTFGFAVHLLGPNDANLALMNRYQPDNPPEVYEHVAPPNEPNQGYAGGSWGSAKHLILTGHIPKFPPPPGRTGPGNVVPTAHYVADFNHVVAKGVNLRDEGTRTLEEELIGIYWGYDGPPEIGTPPRLYMQVVLAVLDGIEFSRTNRLSVDDEIRIIAGIGITLADASIDAWHYKYSGDHMMWRPIVGIRNAVPDNGVAVLNWLPLGRPDTNNSGTSLTPDFPAYPSGHATFGAAALHLLRLFLVEKGIATFDADGLDNVDFDFVSDEYNGRNIDPRTEQPREHITRRYANLWKAILDNSISRVFLGVHWQFDGVTKRNVANTDDEFGIPERPRDLGHTGGVWLGVQIANAIAPKLGIAPATVTAGRV